MERRSPVDIAKAQACFDCSDAVAQSSCSLQLCQQLIGLLGQHLDYRRGAVILKRLSDGRPLIFAHCRGDLDDAGIALEVARLNHLIENRSGGVVHRVVATGREAVIDDVADCQNYISADDAIRSEACFPLTTNGHCIGVLNFESERSHAFDGDDRVLLKTLSTQLALHLDRARLRQFLGLSDYIPALSA